MAHRILIVRLSLRVQLVLQLEVSEIAPSSSFNANDIVVQASKPFFSQPPIRELILIAATRSKDSWLNESFIIDLRFQVRIRG